MADVKPDPDTDRYAYSRTALARLVLSDELRDLADRAASGVPTGSNDSAEPGEEVGAALDLVHQAQKILTRAVLYERAKGTSWETIGDQLDMKKQSAHERYRQSEQDWKDALHNPFDSHGGLRLPHAAYAPTEAGQSLDAWAHERGQGERAVTDGLPTLDLLEEMNQVLEGLTHLYRDMYKGPNPAARLKLLERKAALLDRIAVEEGRPEAAEQAAETRARIAELRAENDGAA